MSASDLWQSSLETFSRSPFSSFAFLKLILYFFQLEKSLDGFSRTWIMIKQSIRVLKCVNSLRGRWLSYKCITLFIPDSWFWQESISQGFILCNFITWKMWKKGYFAIQTFVTLPYFSKCVYFWCLHKICTDLKIKIKMIDFLLCNYVKCFQMNVISQQKIQNRTYQ